MTSKSVCSFALAALLLSGCGGTTARQVLGMDKRSPDAFAVSPQQPLEVPADLNTLPRPTPGVARPQGTTAQVKAEAALLTGGVTPAAAQSAGEAVFLQQAGAASASPDIRAIVNKEAAKDARTQTKSPLGWMVFWKPKPEAGVVVDAAAEAERLKQNAASGQSPTTGGTPVREDSGRLSVPERIE